MHSIRVSTALTAFLVSATPPPPGLVYHYACMLSMGCNFIIYVHDSFSACHVLCFWVLWNKILFWKDMIHWSLHAFLYCLLSTIATYLSLTSETHFQSIFYTWQYITNPKMICNESELNYTYLWIQSMCLVDWQLCLRFRLLKTLQLYGQLCSLKKKNIHWYLPYM